MKIKRSISNFGSGSGKTAYKSDLFNVIHWYLAKGNQTEISTSLADCRILLDGIYDLASDESCLEQYTVEEIMAIIEEQKEIAYEQGREAKANEIKACLNI